MWKWYPPCLVKNGDQILNLFSNMIMNTSDTHQLGVVTVPTLWHGIPTSLSDFMKVNFERSMRTLGR